MSIESPKPMQRESVNPLEFKKNQDASETKLLEKEATEADYQNVLKEQLDIIYTKPMESLRALNDERLEAMHAKDDAEKNNLLNNNKIEGCRREKEVEKELQEEYPEDEGYTIEKEVILRDKDGKIVKDPVTGEARRIDFVVIKDGKVIKSIEVTSPTASKDEQIAKENRIRDAGGNYIKDSNGNLVEIPPDTKTEIVRRD